jgi:hypothetical protein
MERKLHPRRSVAAIARTSIARITSIHAAAAGREIAGNIVQYAAPALARSAARRATSTRPGATS